MKYIKTKDIRINLDTVTTYLKCANNDKDLPYGVMIVFIGKKKSDKYYFSHEKERDKLLKQLDSEVGLK